MDVPAAVWAIAAVGTSSTATASNVKTRKVHLVSKADRFPMMLMFAILLLLIYKKNFNHLGVAIAFLIWCQKFIPGFCLLILCSHLHPGLDGFAHSAGDFSKTPAQGAIF